MHILIIRPGAIGDTLLTLPVIQALREQYNAKHITLVGNAAVLPLAHASGIVDEVYDYQEPRWSRLFLAGGSGRSRDERWETIVKRTQLAICWLHDPDGIVERNLRTAGIQRVIVAPGRPHFPTPEAMHITAYLAETVGLSLQKPLHDMSLSLPDTIQHRSSAPRLPYEHIETDLQGRPSWQSMRTDTRGGGQPHPCAPDEGPVALHPGSGGAHKCWPIERFAKVIYHLWQQHRAVLVLAGPAEQERLVLLRSLLHAYPQLGQCEYLIDAPLFTIARRLRQCQCYLGNDSGLTHLASMLGLPTLALFGPSDPVTWHPPGPSVTILHERALERLSVETVITNLTPFLRSAKNSPFGGNFTL